MSVRGLYTGSKGKYRCLVCFEPTIHKTSSQQDMKTHLISAHPLTTLAWQNRDDPESPEEPPAGDDDDQGDALTDHDELSPEDVFLRSLSHEKLKKWHMGSIECGSHEDAVKRIKSIYELPKQHFIKCFFPCVVDGSVFMAVEEYKKTFSYPTKGHTENAIRHIIKNAIVLYMDGVVGNLKSLHLVDVDYLPKYTSMAVEFQSYDYFRASIEIQSRHICECVDLVVGNGTDDEDYKIFRARLLASNTIVDLQSMLCSSYLTPERQQPIYFCSCRLLSHFTKIDRETFNTIVANFRRECSYIASSSLRNQIPWQECLKNSKHQDLIEMLDTRVDRYGMYVGYDDTSAGNHEFIYNADRHINDQQAKIKTLEDMHRIMKTMFRYYPAESWEYMHVRGLNAYFGSEEFAYGLLNLVSKLTDTSDKNFRFPPLLQALKMCCIMLAQFHNLHQKNNPGVTPFINEIGVAAKEIESCIKGLESSKKEKHNCILIRFDAYQLKDVDKLVFKSVRIILYALEFLNLLVNGEQSVGKCIAVAFSRTMASLSKFTKSDELQMKILRHRSAAIDSSKKWPSVGDVFKITGLSFILTDGGYSAFHKKASDELKKVVEMLKE